MIENATPRPPGGDLRGNDNTNPARRGSGAVCTRPAAVEVNIGDDSRRTPGYCFEHATRFAAAFLDPQLCPADQRQPVTLRQIGGAR